MILKIFLAVSALFIVMYLGGRIDLSFMEEEVTKKEIGFKQSGGGEGRLLALTGPISSFLRKAKSFLASYRY